MTPPLPLGAVRQRPAKSCATCRSAKAKCTGWTDAELALLEDDLDALKGTGKRCTRCQRLDQDCHFLASKRKGRPRRLPKDEKEDGATQSSSQSPAEQQLQLPSPSASVSSPGSFPSTSQPVSPRQPMHLRDTTHDQLAQAYLVAVHPFAPLLPPTLEAASTYLGRSGPALHAAVRALLNPRSTTIDSLTPLNDLRPTLDDLQAGVFSVLVAYGIGKKETAKERLSWCCRALLQLGWEGEVQKDYGLMELNESFRRLGWTCWKMEIQLAVLTGSRDRILGHVSQGQPATSVDSLQRQALSILFIATEVSPADVNEAHNRAQGLITTAHAIYVQAHAHYIQTRDEAAFMTGLMASAATIFLLSSSSIFSTFAAPAFACGIDSTSKPPPSSHRLIVAAAQQIMTLVRASLDPAAATPVHSPFFGCGLLIAVRGLLLSDEGQGVDEGTEGEVQLVETVLEGQAEKWEESRMLLAEVAMLRRTLLL